MRLCVALGCLLLVGCAGPHTTGALWAQQILEREAALFPLSDAQRAERVRQYELELADEALRAEHARVAAGLQDCPGSAREPLAVSAGDRVRDTVRVRAQGDSGRLAQVAHIALADWRLRRARATGEARFCEEARAALAGDPSERATSDVAGRPVTADILARPGTATVARDPRRPTPSTASDERLVDLSLYANGWADAVTAASPLPQYLAAVYGGILVDRPTPPTLNGRTAEELVDEIVRGYPEWEPDAIYAALEAT
jgi:hypothetical protein